MSYFRVIRKNHVFCLPFKKAFLEKLFIFNTIVTCTIYSPFHILYSLYIMNSYKSFNKKTFTVWNWNLFKFKAFDADWNTTVILELEFVVLCHCFSSLPSSTSLPSCSFKIYFIFLLNGKSLSKHQTMSFSFFCAPTCSFFYFFDASGETISTLLLFLHCCSFVTPFIFLFFHFHSRQF